MSQVETKLFVEEEDADDDLFDADEPAPSPPPAASSPAKPSGGTNTSAAAAAAPSSSTAGSSEKENAAAVPPVAAAASVTPPRGDAIYEEDLVTLRVILTRENLSEGEVAPPVHAPHFPKVLREGWWLLLTDKPKGSTGATDSKKSKEKGEVSGGGTVNIYAAEKITDQGRVVSHDLRFLAPARPGDYTMDLYGCSDCYMGLDTELEVRFTVLPAALLPEYVPHPEDVELDNEPTLFEQVMAAPLDDSSDEEEEEKEEDDAVNDSRQKRKEQRKKAKEQEQEQGESTGGTAAAAAASISVGGIILSDLKGDGEKDDEEEEEEEEEEVEDGQED